jgi:hypothetical protein
MLLFFEDHLATIEDLDAVEAFYLASTVDRVSTGWAQAQQWRPYALASRVWSRRLPRWSTTVGASSK